MVFSTCAVRAQDKTGTSALILHATFDQWHELKPAKRKLMAFKKRASYFNPFNYLSAGLLFTYQNVFSEQIQADCNYQVSCSEYTKKCIERTGFVSGTLTGFNQWTECFSGALYEHPPVFRNNHNKIINTAELEVK